MSFLQFVFFVVDFTVCPILFKPTFQPVGHLLCFWPFKWKKKKQPSNGNSYITCNVAAALVEFPQSLSLHSQSTQTDTNVGSKIDHYTPQFNLSQFAIQKQKYSLLFLAAWFLQSHKWVARK